MRRSILILLAFGIGVVVPATYSILYSLLADLPLDFGSDVDVVNIAIVATPYVLLTIFGVRKLLPWAVALALTLSIWAYSLLRSVSYRWEPDGSGADMGTAFLILTSWLWITFAAFVADAVQRYAASRR